MVEPSNFNYVVRKGLVQPDKHQTFIEYRWEAYYYYDLKVFHCRDKYLLFFSIPCDLKRSATKLSEKDPAPYRCRFLGLYLNILSGEWVAGNLPSSRILSLLSLFVPSTLRQEKRQQHWYCRRLAYGMGGSANLPSGVPLIRLLPYSKN